MTDHTVTRKLTARQAAVREQLLAAARDLGRHSDTTNITMGGIADLAGVSRATAFRYFATRDHLLTEAAGITEVTITPDLSTGRFVAEAWISHAENRAGLEADGTGVAATIADALLEAVARTLRSTNRDTAVA